MKGKKKKMHNIINNANKAIAKIVRTGIIIVTIISLSFRAEAISFDSQEGNIFANEIHSLVQSFEDRKICINGISPYVIYEGDEIPDLLENTSIGYKNDYDFIATGVTVSGMEEYKLLGKDYRIEIEIAEDIDTNEVGQNLIVYRLINNDGETIYEETTSLTIKRNLEKHISGIDDLVFKESRIDNLEDIMVIDNYIKEVVIDDDDVRYDTPGEYQVTFTLVGEDDEVMTLNRVITIEKIYGIHEEYELVGETLQEQVWNFLIDHGLTELQAAAIMGNISAECGWRPDAVEAGNHIGYGLIQWSYGRRAQLEAYARAMGIDKSDVKLQLTFMLMEMSLDANERQGYCNYQFTGGYDSLFANGTTPEDVARAFCNGFERPAEFVTSGSYRQTEARYFYDLFL